MLILITNSISKHLTNVDTHNEWIWEYDFMMFHVWKNGMCYSIQVFKDGIELQSCTSMSSIFNH